MNRHIFVVTRLDHLPNETPQVSIAGLYFDKEQAYENALVFQLQQMIENTSNWPTQAIQRQRDKILKRCHSLPLTTTVSSYQSKFHYLFPPFDSLFNDLCNVSHHVHDCLPLPLNETTQPTSMTNTTTTTTNFVETPVLQTLMTTLQALLNDEEDLAHSDGEDDDDEEEDEDEDEDEDDNDNDNEADDAEVDAEEDDIDDDSEDEMNEGDIMTNNSNNDGDEDDDNEKDEMDGSDDDDDDDEQVDPAECKEVIEISEDEDDVPSHGNNYGLLQQQYIGNSYRDTVTTETTTTTKPLGDMMDDGNMNSDDDIDDDEEEFIGGGGGSGNVTLLSPPHSDQKQPLSDGDVDEDDLDEDEIDELNDDEDEAPNKRRRTDL